VIGLAVVFVVAGGTSLAIAGQNASRPLRTLVLRASQVGPGYRIQQPNVQSAVQVGGGMSACFRAPKGAAKGSRSFGRSYVKPGSPDVFDALVQYRSTHALAEIMTALRRVVNRCPSQEVKLAAGVFARIQVSRSTARHLLRGSLALREVISGTVGGHKYTSILLGIYQTKGRMLSLVFAGGKNLGATRAIVMHAAQESALNLR
jgi:Fe-S cluster assembly scaffold protein SufB